MLNHSGTHPGLDTVGVEFSYTGHRDGIYRLLPDPIHPNSHFLSAAGDGWLIRWSLANPAEAGVVVASLPSSIYAAVPITGGNRLCLGTRFGGLYHLDLASSKLLWQSELAADIFAMQSLPDNPNLVVAAMAKGCIQLIDLHAQVAHTPLHISEASVRCIALGNTSASGDTTMYFGCSDGFIYQYVLQLSAADSTGTWQLLRSWKAHDLSVFDLQLLPSGTLLSGGRDAQLKAWDTAADIPTNLQAENAHWYAINRMALSPSGTFLATASRDKTIKIWSQEAALPSTYPDPSSNIAPATSNWILRKVLDGKFAGAHTHSVNALLWVGDTCLLTAGDDRAVRQWKLELE